MSVINFIVYYTSLYSKLKKLGSSKLKKMRELKNKKKKKRKTKNDRKKEKNVLWFWFYIFRNFVAFLQLEKISVLNAPISKYQWG